MHFADWNNDGLKDLIVGNTFETRVYVNTGTREEPVFAEAVILKLDKQSYPIKSSPYLFDIDNDGKLDLIISNGGISFYKNTGTNEKPEYGNREKLDFGNDEFKTHFYKRLCFTDWNNDGKLDLLVGTSYPLKSNKLMGNVWLFLGK